MLRNVAVAAALAQTLAWTPAADSVRRTPLHAAEETDALAQIQSLEELIAARDRDVEAENRAAIERGESLRIVKGPGGSGAPK